MPTKGKLITYREETDTFNLRGPHGEEIMTFSPDELRELISEGSRLYVNRESLLRSKERGPLNDSAEVPHQGA